MPAWKPHHVSFAPVPRWAAPVVFAIVAGLAWFFYASVDRSFHVACARQETGEVACDIDESAGFDTKHAHVTLNEKSTARVLPVMTSSDTPDTVALQLGSTDGTMYQSIPMEGPAGLEAALAEIERCRGGEASCTSGFERTPIRPRTAWLVTAAGFVAAILCLVSKRVSIDPGNVRIESVLLGLRLTTHAAFERGIGEAFLAERNEEGPGGKVMLRVDTAEEKNRRIVIASMSLDEARGVVRSLNAALAGKPSASVSV